MEPAPTADDISSLKKQKRPPPRHFFGCYKNRILCLIGLFLLSLGLCLAGLFFFLYLADGKSDEAPTSSNDKAAPGYFAYNTSKFIKNGQNGHGIPDTANRIESPETEVPKLTPDETMKWLESLGYKIPSKNRTIIYTRLPEWRKPTTIQIKPSTTSTTTITKPKVDTYFSHEDRKFPRLRNDEKIPTIEFLRACESIGEFTGLLGSVFGAIKGDVYKNVNRIREKYDENPSRYQYLQDLIRADLEANDWSISDDSVSKSALWLKRANEFVLELLKFVVQEYETHSGQNVPESLVPIIEKAYENTLARHHNWFKRQVFKGLKYAAPYRSEVIKVLAMGHSGIEDVVMIDVKEYLVNFNANIQALKRFFNDAGLEEVY